MVHSDDVDKTLTIGDAMLQCSIGNGRLLPISTCDEIPILLLALYQEFGKTDQKSYYLLMIVSALSATKNKDSISNRISKI